MATRNPAKNRFILLVVSPVIYQGFSIIPGAVGVLARISGSQAFTEETFFQFGGGCDSQSMDPCKEAQVFLGGENNGSKWKKKTTPPKFNIVPEKWWLEDYFPIGMVYFQSTLNFGRAVSWWWQLKYVFLIFTANLGKIPIFDDHILQRRLKPPTSSCLGYVKCTRLYWGLLHNHDTIRIPFLQTTRMTGLEPRDNLGLVAQPGGERLGFKKSWDGLKTPKKSVKKHAKYVWKWQDFFLQENQHTCDILPLISRKDSQKRWFKFEKEKPLFEPSKPWEKKNFFLFHR